MTRVVNEGDLLWTPSAERIAEAELTLFMRWLERERKLKFASYEELWRWSVSDLPAFWSALWDYFEIEASTPYRAVLGKRTMPGAEWFPGAKLNYAQHALRHERPGKEALLYLNERSPLREMSWPELAGKVRVFATRLRELGVKPGDRVVACLPNIPEAVIAVLGTTSIGAIWSSCGPDFGTRGVLDRFSQLAPKVMLCVDGYQYGGKPFSRKAEMRDIIGQLTSLERVIYLPYLNPEDRAALSTHTILWDEMVSGPPVAAGDFRFEQVPFSHPLWILFSSGTTGLPKPIIHSHGGILLEQLKLFHFHADMHARERMFFFTTTGWMMWNFLVSALLSDVVPVLYDGNPAYPQPDVLWKMVEDSGTSLFGASPTYVSILQKAGIVPKDRFNLSKLKTIMLAGSPVTPECQAWFFEAVKKDLWAHSGSGGTDVCAGVVGGVVTLPIYAGEIQARSLGCAVHAFNERGEKVINEVGELVITEPMPSMPVGFWNDTDGSRYRSSYFEEYPGVWRHGDFFRINERGGCFVLGRSDATLNRHGVRIGTAEIYRSLASLEGVDDSLIVNLDLPGGTFFMPLFVKLREGMTLDEAVAERIRAKLRKEYSPRHVPDKIYPVEAIPYTLSGKKMEVPVRRILMGMAPEKAANRDATVNPQALDYFVHYARTQKDYQL
ncbi:MAG TPA: acetoacetate--CoA ligase [Steroidobacteraceae bacterium]|nr:acetoacetate--CoA ligase [Steroidobacteraceae bacterium]